MPKSVSRIIQGGRITVPADVRHDLDLEPGDRVIVDVERWPSEHDDD